MANTTITELFNSRIFNPKAKPKREVVITVRESVVGTLQSFVVFTGLPKASKSTFIAGAIASAYCTYDVFHIKITPPAGRSQILYVDTESSEYDFYQQIEKIRAQLLRNSLPQELVPISCREDEPGTIIKLIEYYLDKYKECAIVVIDGLLDLINNYNDEREGKQLINWLKKITKKYDCLVICVIHQSKGSGNTLGHLGSMADRYCQSSLEIVKEKSTNQFVMKPKLLRSVGDFDPVAIQCINGNWGLCDYIEPETILTKPKAKPNK